jgi:hypothetical protein
MSQPIQKALDALPKTNMTTRVLSALDWVVPGQWKNTVGFENMIREVTGETDSQYVRKIGERAITLYNDKTQGYQRAMWLYHTVDNVQGITGTAAMLGKLAESFSLLSFLKYLTPKPDTVQTIDLGTKLVTEVVAFCALNGLPGDRVDDFVESLADYRHEALMRLGALICLDGVLPLGPDFVSKAMSMIQGSGASAIISSPRFKALREAIPGNSATEQLELVQKSLAGTQGFVNGFVKEHGITVQKITDNLKKYVDGIEGKLDYLSAFLDMTVNYYEHTGTQTVARSLISRAAAEI